MLISGNGSNSDPRKTLTALSQELDLLSNRLDGAWDFDSGAFQPSEKALATHAREKRIAMLPAGWVRCLKAVYYPLTVCLGSAYSFAVADIQAWEGLLGWAGQAGVTLAFVGGSLLIMSSWKNAAISRYREPSRWSRNKFWLAVGATAGFLLVDFAASYTLFTTATEVASLGASRVPPAVVVLLAGLTTLAQLLGAHIGHASGVRDEVKTYWWSKVTASRGPELEQVAKAAGAVRQSRRELESAEQVPWGHVDRSG